MEPEEEMTYEEQEDYGRSGHEMEGGGSGSGGGPRKPHSVKVPRLYKEAAKALKQVEEGDGLKNAIHSLKHPNVKALTALVSEALRHSDLLSKLITKSKILEHEKGLSYQVPLAKILITELLWGKKRLGGTSKPVTTVLSYSEKFDKVINKIERKERNKAKDSDAEPIPVVDVAVKKPRYVRVNTLKTDLASAIAYLTEEGWIQKETEDYINLNGDYFAVDNFVDNMLVFPSGTELYRHPLYLDGSFVLQDKASCLPPLALKPRVGRVVLDACAAPGMKTSLMSALTKNEGSIIAVEKDSKRCDTLRTMLEGLGVTNVTVMNKDFTDISPHDHPEVEYILVDPSCSGSGMINRVEMQHGPGAKKNRDRLKALAFYQRKLLVHAMKFPNVKRIVYSTCSINSSENEDVVAAALEWGDGYANANNPEGSSSNNTLEPSSSVQQDTSYFNFRVKEALSDWPHRIQNPNYEWSDLCVKADFENDFTDGFFVAVLERVKKGK